MADVRNRSLPNRKASPQAYYDVAMVVPNPLKQNKHNGSAAYAEQGALLKLGKPVDEYVVYGWCSRNKGLGVSLISSGFMRKKF